MVHGPILPLTSTLVVCSFSRSPLRLGGQHLTNGGVRQKGGGEDNGPGWLNPGWGSVESGCRCQCGLEVSMDIVNFGMGMGVGIGMGAGVSVGMGIGIYV